MMAYDSQFVIAILHNGHPVREINGTASVPFNSEYKIRLKNKHSYLRAKARVWVDGRKASNRGDFILKPGETMDLERFLDNDMNSGNKFKFVPLSDRKVNDPTDPSNGIIKVEFYRETDFVGGITIDGSKPWKPIPVKPWDGKTNGDITWQNNTIPCTFTSGGGGTTSCSTNVNYVQTSNFVHDVHPVADDAGATVEGSISGQTFVYVDDFSTEFFAVTLTLKLKGISEPQVSSNEYYSKGSKKKIRFCAHCGRRRPRMADKFCPRCGNSY